MINALIIIVLLMSNRISVENDQEIPFLEKPQSDDLNLLESHYNYFMIKCDDVEKELYRPGNKKDYTYLQKIWKSFLQLDFRESVEKIFYKVKKDSNLSKETDSINSILCEKVQCIKQKVDKISKLFLELLDTSIISLERDISSNRKLYIETPISSMGVSNLNMISSIDQLTNNQKNYSDKMKDNIKKTQEIIDILDTFKKKVYFTKSSIDQLYNNIKSNINLRPGQTIDEDKIKVNNQKENEELVSNSRFCCLTTTIGILLLILVTLIIAYFLKLSSLIIN